MTVETSSLYGAKTQCRSFTVGSQTRTTNSEVPVYHCSWNNNTNLSEVLNSCIHFTEGTSIEATVNGKRQVRLLKFNETYEVDCPNLLIRLLPSPSVDWSGTVRIACKESGLEAELSYHRIHSFLGIGGDTRCVKGKVFRSSSGSQETVCEIDGHWDSTVSMKDVQSGEVSVLYDAKRAIADLATPEVKDQEVNFFYSEQHRWNCYSLTIILCC
jgi:hypothetical protein